MTAIPPVFDDVCLLSLTTCAADSPPSHCRRAATLLPGEDGGRRVGRLRFEVLGQVRVTLDGRELDLGPGKQRAVLAALVLRANRPVSISEIVDAVWAEDPPANGPNVVQKHIAGLRKVFEPDRTPRAPGQSITLTAAGYTLNVPPGSLDVERFHAMVAHARSLPADDAEQSATALREALGLWRGPALAGLDGAVFEAERDRLHEIRTATVEDCLDLELQLGRHVESVPELVQLTAQHPYRERLRGLLMLALYRSGRQADALAVFRDTRRQLADELGIEPGEHLRTLHDRMLAGDPTLLLDAPGPRSRRSRPSPGLAGWWLVLVPLLSMGFLTWAVFLIAAAMLRAVLVWLSTAVYFGIVMVVLTRQTDDLSVALLAVPWLVGAVHGLFLRPKLCRRSEHANDPAVTKAMAAKARREEARRVLATDPGLARELRIGRPDLPRDYDDGGLVDVNSVPEQVLSSLGGFTAEQAVRIVVDRELVGGFTSVDDLVARGLVTVLAAQAMRERLVFLR